jgi:hypothetical protein
MCRFVILIVLVLLLSCKKKVKEEPDVPKHYTIEAAELKQYAFNSGTYWVYKDSVSNSIDSTYVYNYNHTMYSRYSGDDYEIYEYRIFPGFVNDDRFTISYAGFMLCAESPYSGIKLVSDNSSEVQSNITRVHFDSLFVYDRYYKNVWRVSVKTNTYSCFNSDRKDYFINPEYGFIRRDYYSNSGALTNRKFLMRKNIVR